MAYAQKQNGQWTELSVGLPVTHDDLQASYETITLWTENERNAFGVFMISDNPPVQSGKIAVVGSIVDINNFPVRSYTLVDAPINTDPPYYIPPSILRQRAMKIGLWDDLAAYLVQFPSLLLMTLTLEEGIDPHYPELISGFNSLGVPQEIQDYLLSDPSLGVY